MGRLSKLTAAARPGAPKRPAEQKSAVKIKTAAEAPKLTGEDALRQAALEMSQREKFSDFVRDNLSKCGFKRRSRNPQRAPNHKARELSVYAALFMATVLIGTMGAVMGVGLVAQVYKDFQHTLSLSGAFSVCL